MRVNTLVSGEKPCFQALSKGLVVLLCSEVVRQRIPDHGAVHSECSATAGWINYMQMSAAKRRLSDGPARTFMTSLLRRSKAVVWTVDDVATFVYNFAEC